MIDRVYPRIYIRDNLAKSMYTIAITSSTSRMLMIVEP